jgi:hypothetical protein
MVERDYPDLQTRWEEYKKLPRQRNKVALCSRTGGFFVFSLIVIVNTMTFRRLYNRISQGLNASL